MPGLDIGQTESLINSTKNNKFSHIVNPVAGIVQIQRTLGIQLVSWTDRATSLSRVKESPTDSTTVPVPAPGWYK